MEERKYTSKGINDLSLPQRIMMFVVDNSQTQKKHQGVISICCENLWNMSEKEFETIFGVTITSNQNIQPKTKPLNNPLGMVQQFIYTNKLKQDTISQSDIIKHFTDKGFKECDISKCIDKLKNLGDIYEPAPGKWKIIT